MCPDLDGSDMLPDPFRWIRARRNSAKIQQRGHAQGLDQRSKIEKYGKDGGLERLGCGTIQKEMS